MQASYFLDAKLLTLQHPRVVLKWSLEPLRFSPAEKNISDWLLSTGRDALRKLTQSKTLNSHSQTWPPPRSSSSNAYSPKQTMVLEAQGSLPYPHKLAHLPRILCSVARLHIPKKAPQAHWEKEGTCVWRELGTGEIFS